MRSAAQGDGADAGERGDEVRGPWPGLGESADGASAGGDEVSGGVEQAVAQPFRFGVGYVAGEGEEPGPGEQVVGGEDELQPGLLIWNECDGRLVSPVALVSQIWRSARPRPR